MKLSIAFARNTIIDRLERHKWFSKSEASNVSYSWIYAKQAFKKFMLVYAYLLVALNLYRNRVRDGCSL